MSEGELLKNELRLKYKSMKTAAKDLDTSHTTLYDYFKKDRLPTDFVELLNDKLGIDIRKNSIETNNNALLEKKIKDLEAEIDILNKKMNTEISEMKSYILKLLTK